MNKSNSNNFYNDLVMDGFLNPHNYGKLDNPDGVGEVGNVVCGDVMKIYLKVKTQKNKIIIADISFETYGCAAAIATSSMITDLARGKTLEKAWEIKNEDLADSLSGLPPIKMHCSVLAADALKEAIFNYLVKNKQKIPEEYRKIHQKLQKNKQVIEERYQPWIEAERKKMKEEKCEN